MGGFRHTAPCIASENPAVKCVILVLLVVLIFMPVAQESTSFGFEPSVCFI